MAGTFSGIWSGDPKERIGGGLHRAGAGEVGYQVRELRLKGQVLHPGPGTLSVTGASDEPIRCKVLARSEPTDGLVVDHGLMPSTLQRRPQRPCVASSAR